MITGIFKVLFCLAMFVASPFVLLADARMTDSAKDMLAAGRIDDAISELNGRLAAAPSDAESSNLLCRAYFTSESGTVRNRPARKPFRSTLRTVVFICGLGGFMAKRRIAPIS